MLGRWVVCLIDPAIQRIILKIVGFQKSCKFGKRKDTIFFIENIGMNQQFTIEIESLCKEEIQRNWMQISCFLESEAGFRKRLYLTVET